MITPWHASCIDDVASLIRRQALSPPQTILQPPAYRPSSCLTTYQTRAFELNELQASQFFRGCQHNALIAALVSYRAISSPE